MKNDEYLLPKPRYENLDGLRGVAAIMVIIFHCFETYIPRFGTQIINHGYLAVDFFFVLSGFVIGYAYDDRWSKMTAWGFFKRRLVRLHPMVVAGTVIGASLFFYGDCEGFPLISSSPGWKIALCFLMGILMIPAGTGLDIRGWGETNSFNGPNWSLTLEYIGNVLYAFVFRRLPTLALIALCAMSAVLTLDLTLGWDIFGILTAELGRPQFSVIGGWSLTPAHMYIGITRLLFPFICGLILSRVLSRRSTPNNPSGSPIRIKAGFLCASLMLVAVFSVPCIGGKEGFMDGVYQAVCILVILPAAVIVGAGSQAENAVSSKICKFLGEISYPLYITHFPIIYMQIAWVGNHPDADIWQHIMLNVGVVSVSLILAWGVYKAYDLPVRDWLTSRLLHRGAAEKG